MIILYLACLLLSSCAMKVCSKASIDQEIERRLGNCLAVDDGSQAALLEPLAVSDAVCLALARSPSVRAQIAKLGISEADLWEAGLWPNPLFEAFWRKPNKSGFSTNNGAAVLFKLIQLIQLPKRQSAALAELEKTKAEVIQAIVGIGFSVEEAYYSLLAAEKRQSLLTQLEEVHDLASELAQRQAKAGNIDPMAVNSALAASLEAKREIIENKQRIAELKAELRSLMALPGRASFVLSQQFPDPRWWERGAESLQEIALAENPEFQEITWEIQELADKLGLESPWSYTMLSAGISTEKEVEGVQVTGPAIEGEVPLFNWGQAARYRLAEELKQARERLAEREIEIVKQVQACYETLVLQRELLQNYQKGILPSYQKNMQLAQELHNVMGAGINKLLDSKVDVLQAELAGIDIYQKYLLSIIKLERSIGGKIYALLDCH